MTVELAESFHSKWSVDEAVLVGELIGVQYIPSVM